MDRKAVDGRIHTWSAEDFAEYWKLIDLSLPRAYNGLITTFYIIRVGSFKLLFFIRFHCR